MLVTFLSLNLWAQAGTSIFTYGKVDLRNNAGAVTQLQRGTELNSGDAVITGVNGRAQLRMQDGAIFDLKPNSEFIIEEYVYQGSRTVAGQIVNTEENKGFYRLMRGGFRAISGLIGKRNKKNYRVRTPVATIGIRGTDYTVELCDVNCAANGSGLYVSVASGGIVMANAGGSLDVDVGQLGFAANASSGPVLAGAASASSANQESSEVTFAKNAVDEAGNLISLDTGADVPQEVVVPSTPGQVAVSVNGTVEQSTVGGANISTTGRDALGEFSTSENTYNSGSSSVTNQGYDTKTGLFWGRWSNGTATATNEAGSSDVDLNSSSAHWVYTTNQVTPVLPVTGTANFNLIGNTNPTDNMGNSGVLGTAGLSADFTNQTVDADVNLSINDQTWDATATDVALDGDAATFAGDFDTVTITDEASQATTDGSGELSGFITGDEAGDISGAGLAYSLTDDAETTVEGTAAFEVTDVKP